MGSRDGIERLNYAEEMIGWMVPDTKQKIIDSAIELFAEYGYTETNMRAIAEKTGIKASSIYNHFKSKGEILEHIITMYKNYTRSSLAGMNEIDRMINAGDIEAILNRLFYVLPSDSSDIYMDILKIIIHEQYREPLAMDFMKDYFFGELYEYIKLVLDKLVERGIIKPTFTGYYSRMILSVTLSTSIEVMFYTPGEYPATERITRQEMNQFLINQLRGLAVNAPISGSSRD